MLTGRITLYMVLHCLLATSNATLVQQKDGGLLACSTPFMNGDPPFAFDCHNAIAKLPPSLFHHAGYKGQARTRQVAFVPATYDSKPAMSQSGTCVITIYSGRFNPEIPAELMQSLSEQLWPKAVNGAVCIIDACILTRAEEGDYRFQLKFGDNLEFDFGVSVSKTRPSSPATLDSPPRTLYQPPPHPTTPPKTGILW